MKILILYCSDYNKNTEKVAKAFAEKADCELINICNADNINIDKYNLIGFGSGVYRESLSPKLSRVVDKLNLKEKNVFVFSTSGAGMKFYNNSLIKQLQSKGAKNKGNFACKGSFVAEDFTDKKIFHIASKLSKGHPSEKDIKEARAFMEKLVLSL